MCSASVGPENAYFIGVDVGTGSVRTGLFSSQGKLVQQSEESIRTWRQEIATSVHFEQSSEDIWRAVVTTVKAVCKDTHTTCVAGIGFAATCSLVAINSSGQPVTVSLSRENQRNVILWQDHRAFEEAKEINDTHHPVLSFVGGKISPEMQPPKLLWLKRHLNEECWKETAHFFDLVDYLTYRATDVTSRSLCCLVCKWTYIGHQPRQMDLCKGWNNSFWEAIGLSDLVQESYARIGTVILTPGTPVGRGLSESAAKDLGLTPGMPVATGVIDAHAGGLGVIGAPIEGELDCPLTSRCVLVGGTSTCHMASSCDPIFIPGVWGPYYSAMCPGYFLNEGGQSSSGQLIDFVINGYCPEVLSQLKQLADLNHCTIYEQLEQKLQELAGGQYLSFLTKDLHVYPDFVGNRSPLADPNLKGMCSGLDLTQSIPDLVRLYLATIQSLAYGTRHIIEAMQSRGHQFKVLLICGGLSKNKLYLETQADVLGISILLPESNEAVCLGSAILAAVASGVLLEEAMSSMSKVSLKASLQPTRDTAIIQYHNLKYAVFKEMLKDQRKYSRIMNTLDA